MHHNFSESGSISSSGGKGERSFFFFRIVREKGIIATLDKHVYLKKKTFSVSQVLWINLERWMIFKILLEIIINNRF